MSKRKDPKDLLPRGRPTDYTLELSDEICARLSEGESMRSVCRDDAMPVLTTIFRWLRTKPEFKQQYDIAKEESAESHADQMIDIADNEVSQPVLEDGLPLVIDGKIVMKIDQTAIAHAKLRIDTRKWAASKLNPRKYGEKQQIEHSGKIGLADLTDEELARKLEELQNQ